jgi:hypothetical protein
LATSQADQSNLSNESNQSLLNSSEESIKVVAESDSVISTMLQKCNDAVSLEGGPERLLHQQKHLNDIVDYFLWKKGSCKIADLGSSYNGSWNCFRMASPVVQIDAVDVIFADIFIPGQSPLRRERETYDHPYVNFIGENIEEFLQKSTEKYDLIVFKEVYNLQINLVDVICRLNLDGVFLVGTFNSYVSPTLPLLEKERKFAQIYLGFDIFWKINDGYAMSRRFEVYNMQYPTLHYDFYLD